MMPDTDSYIVNSYRVLISVEQILISMVDVLGTQNWSRPEHVSGIRESVPTFGGFELLNTTPVEFVAGLPWWAGVAAIILVSTLAAAVLNFVILSLRSRVTENSNADAARITVQVTHVPLYATVFLLGVYISAQLVPFARAVFVLEAASISLLLIAWASAIVQLTSQFLTVSQPDRSGREIVPVLKNSVSVVVTIVTGLLLLAVCQIDITPILASAGVIGIVLGIAARDTIGNFFAGISLYFDRTYAIGDMVQLESGERGTVIDMSIRSTTILTRDNIAVTIPNSELNTTQVINESAPIRRRRIRLDVGVAYGSDLETVERAILDAASDEDVVLDSPRPKVRFREFADSAIVAQLQCYIDNPAQRGKARHCLIRRIDGLFDEADIKIPFPQQEVTFFESGNEIALERTESPNDGLEDDPLSVGNGADSESTTPETRPTDDAGADDQSHVQLGTPDETD